MNDYGFGNTLTALREDMGLSQYQLGMLVGVSDKAVSKWENGNARPRIKVCEKLAKLFHISVDELLRCQIMVDTHSKEQEIREKCRARLKEIYGDSVPVSFSTRLEAELTTFTGTGVLELADIIGQIYRKTEKGEMHAVPLSPVQSSMTAWLLSATALNPLKPHYFCPECKKVNIYSEMRDAWELPEKQCGCGHRMLREGHDIPFHTVFSNIKRIPLYADFRVYESEINLLHDSIDAYYGESGHLIEYECDPDPNQSAVKNMHFILMDGNDKLPEKDTSEKLKLNWNKYKEIAKDRIGFSFIVDDNKTRYIPVPPAEQFITKDCLQQVYQSMLGQPDYETVTDKDGNQIDIPMEHPIRDIARFVDPEKLSPSLLLRLQGLDLAGDLWSDNGKSPVESGALRIDELFTCSEDIWSDIVQRMKKGDWLEIGFADKIMDDIKNHRYRKQPMDETTVAALRDLGYSEEMIRYIESLTFHYTWPKESLITYFLQKHVYPVNCNHLSSSEGGYIRYLPERI